MKTISGRYFVAPQADMDALVQACNENTELTVQTAQAMAQKMSTDELEPFCVAQVVRVVNPEREEGK